MGLIQNIRQLISGSEPTFVDYEMSQNSATGTDGPMIAGRVGPGSNLGMGPHAGNYKIQQSYDSLLETVQQLRASLDGQTRRQEELLSKLGTLPKAAEALPPTSRLQNDMLAMIQDRLSMHAEQQKKIADLTAKIEPGAKKDLAEVINAIKDQIEMSNEVDRQLVESFNRFSVTIDRLHSANNHAIEALQHVRDSYSATAMQMQEWIERSRDRNGWLVGISLLMSAISLISVITLMYMLSSPAK